MVLFERNKDGSLRLFRNKKGALELSVTGIVVLIIAITVLGLVIFFLKKTFPNLEDIFRGEIGRIKRELINTLEKSGELLALHLAEIELNVGEPQKFFIAIRNTGQNREEGKNSVCFMLKFECLMAFSPSDENTCEGVPNGQQPLFVGGMDPESPDERPQNNWFQKIPGGGRVDIANLESDAFRITALIKGGKPDTYRVKLSVFKSADDKDCVDASTFVLYASKTFDVVLT